MNERFYTVEELAGILQIHPKTVLRFIRDGKIKAQKVGRSWRISHEALVEYAHPHPDSTEENPGTVDYSSLGDRMRVSAIIEINEQNSEEASRLSNSLMAALNSKDPSWGNARFDSFYYPEAQKAKYVLYGTPTFISEIMTMLTRLSETERSAP